MPAATPADTSTEHIARDIAAAIVSHRLPPGTRLREEALARAYGVSRTKIRAALLMLSKDKLIRTVPDKGAFVSKPSAAEAREIFSVRRILETAMAREFVARARPADYKRIEQHLKQERKAIAGNDVQLRNRLLGDFHILLAEVAGNSVLTEMLRELSARSAIITVLYQSNVDAACSSDEHHAFLDAARKGDVETACKLMVEHLDHVEQGLDFAAEADGDGDLVAALLT
ncbi:GntR family transcriptional regulator [Bordetella bronchialis]|uniref:GntR family transcriptional regulator n=1 Tax=Bordetella bronchialis TaxID=463025 RepID=A0A193FB29_9BORD|nr:GntR family transcriptional regulator [Bordetella bronchialis]ANN64992.1 GntR family transcriptional regulator [Bordetella bronchialis]ANN70022.1 GntR family transcriptional regulator [Bordetella bronchialis]